MEEKLLASDLITEFWQLIFAQVLNKMADDQEVGEVFHGKHSLNNFSLTVSIYVSK